jgi:hypothetical protein
MGEIDHVKDYSGKVLNPKKKTYTEILRLQVGNASKSN